MTDVRLFHTADGGEMLWQNGEPDASEDGLETAVYLSMFGGNHDDNGLAQGEKRQWWGNLTEEDPEKKHRSETQYLLASLPPTVRNLRLVQAAAERDLSWLTQSVAKSVSVLVTMPALNRVDIAVQVIVDTTSSVFRFATNWPLNGSPVNT